MTAKRKNNFKCRQCDKAFTFQSNRTRAKKGNIFLFFPWSEAYSETCQVFKMTFFAKIINGYFRKKLFCANNYFRKKHHLRR